LLYAQYLNYDAKKEKKHEANQHTEDGREAAKKNKPF